MSTYQSTVWAISCQKLQRAGADESGDTLRRSVLIHNIIKQHSQPPSPVAYHHPHHEQLHHHHHPQSEVVEYPEDAKAPQSSNVFVFPVMEDYDEPIEVDPSSATGEQDWLDGVLNDLDDEVHVVPADGLEHNAVASEPSFASSVNFPLFSPSEYPQPSHCHHPEPAYPSETQQPTPSNSLYYGLGDEDPNSPPASPPDLMEHNVDSDDDEDDWDPLCSTPDASTDRLGPGRHGQFDAEYFFHMPFQRHRPALATHHFNMH